MDFPNRIKVVALKKADGDPVGGLAIMIKLKMQSKNDHNIGPKFTDERGVSMFSVSEITEEMEATKEASPMDYVGGLESCKALEALVMGHDAIQRLLKARETWGAASSRWSLSNETLQALQLALKQGPSKGSIQAETKSLHDDIVIYV